MAAAIGIDLGGTNLRVALVDGNGRRLAEHIGPLPACADAGALITHVAERAKLVQGSAKPEGLGLAIAGTLDAQDQLVEGMANLPVLAGRPLAAELRAATGLAVRIENDARAAMLGEARFGAARGVRNALILTLGTGVGGGLLLDGRLRPGSHRMAGEIGLTLAWGQAGAGGYVSLENAASPGGLRRTRGLDLEQVSTRAAGGDAAAQAELDRVHELLAAAIVNAHVMLDLERVLLAGGMAQAGAPLRDAIRRAFSNLAPPAFRDTLTIDLAALGPWSGAMGAAALWLETTNG